MKSLLLFFFYLALVTGSPLSDRSVFRRNNGVPLNARRFILRSEPQAPPACASGVQLPTSPVSAIPTAVTPTATVSGISDTNINTTDTSFDPIQTLSANVTDSEVSSADASATQSLNNSTNTSVPTLTSTTSDAVNTSLSRRFAQFDLPDLALTWQDLCLSSGGDIFTNEPCVDLAGLGGINALLANADPCDQQNAADAMIDFAKSEGVINSEELIAFALQYRKHPRNALNILGFVPSTPYCSIAPKNVELIGVWNDQLQGVVPGLFGGPDFPVVAFGADGTCPFGLTPDVSTCSCVSSGTNDSNGIDTGITADGLNGTDTSSNSTISADGTNSTETGSLDTSDSSNSTDTSGSVDSGVISDGNSTDASASTSVDSGDAGTDSASSTTSSSDTASTAAVDSNGSVTDSTTGASTADTAVDTATVTDATTQNTTPSATDTELAFNTGRPDVNDPQGR